MYVFTIGDFAFRIERNCIPKFDFEFVGRVFLRKEDFLRRICAHVERGNINGMETWGRRGFEKDGRESVVLSGESFCFGRGLSGFRGQGAGLTEVFFEILGDGVVKSGHNYTIQCLSRCG